MYDRDFKLEAVKMVQEKGYSLREASQLLGISKNTLSDWLKSYKEHGEVEVFPGTWLPEH